MFNMPAANGSSPRSEKLDLLVLADSDAAVEPLAAALRGHGWTVRARHVLSVLELAVQIGVRLRPVVVVPANTRKIDLLDAVRAARATDPDVAFIVVDVAPRRAIDLIRAGATDCVLEGESDSLGKVVEAAVLRAEEAATHRHAEHRFRSLIENIPLGIVVHRDGKIVYANPVCLRALGVERLEDLVGRDPLALVVESDRERLGERVVWIAAGESVEPIETAVLVDGGKTLPVEVAGFRLDDAGQLSIVTVAREIRREREMQLRMALADRMVSVGMVAAGVAHEVNTPLSSVQLNVDFALEKVAAVGNEPAAGADVVDALEEARVGATRVREIVRDLRALSRPDDRPPERVELPSVLDAAINMAMNEIRSRAHVVTEYGSVPLVSGVPGRLTQVFLNLLVNAAHAITPGNVKANTICVSTSTDDDGRAVVTVGDTGCGMPADVLCRVFDPFFTTKPIGLGTGLGLTISQGIVAEHGGEISLSSELGRGTTIRVALPAARSTSAPAAEAKPSPLPEAKRRILAVDDDASFGAALRRILGGHDATVVASGAAALEKIRAAERYDVILLDLSMPGMSGTEVHAELLRLDSDQAARVVFMTGGTPSGAVERFLGGVPNLQIDKPFTAAQLRAVLQKV
jgi:PAS domain S-box-containing protein